MFSSYLFGTLWEGIGEYIDDCAGRVPDIQDAIFLRYLAHDVLSRLPGSRQGSDGVN
jgi:hypothetical protein